MSISHLVLRKDGKSLGSNRCIVFTPVNFIRKSWEICLFMSAKCKANTFKYSLIERRSTFTNIRHVTGRLCYKVSQNQKLKFYRYFMKTVMTIPSFRQTAYLSISPKFCIVTLYRYILKTKQQMKGTKPSSQLQLKGLLSYSQKNITFSKSILHKCQLKSHKSSNYN